MCLKNFSAMLQIAFNHKKYYVYSLNFKTLHLLLIPAVVMNEIMECSVPQFTFHALKKSQSQKKDTKQF